MDVVSPVGACVSKEEFKSSELKQLNFESPSSLCHVTEDVSLNELVNGFTGFVKIQDDHKLVSHSILSQPFNKIENPNAEKEDKYHDPNRSESTIVISKKCLSKCATFPCSGKKTCFAVYTGHDGHKEDEKRESDMRTGVVKQNDYEMDNLACARSISLPTPLKLVSAMKGSRERQGIQPKKLTVSWAPDVYDPPPSASTSLGFKKVRPNGKKNYDHRKNGKNRKKGKSSRGGSSKDKKQVRLYGGSSSKFYPSRDDVGRVDGRIEPCGGLQLLDIGSPDSYCGSSFLKRSVKELHFSMAEAT
ncbi:uncharacterized protein LOC127787978 [Diospyros lotus]|uniref:uncharacterized protein LOC127787978 n=1 Tax=Diospyros lotus TaxID=55363 RepID=UPI002251B15E|nr:uncharacterized protein LOC127787978 [Diospyros lotus]